MNSDADVDMGERERNPGRASVFRAEARWEGEDGITHDKIIVLKVVRPPFILSTKSRDRFHGSQIPAHDTTDIYAPDLFITESISYARLSKAGLCKKGYIPSFYGSYHFPPSWSTSPTSLHSYRILVWPPSPDLRA
ncbi:hypothetical protein SISSUDRAFT_1052882 [Sistotremastrum suecicum HHB10207 ss-3]|uniref:Uncharacterized protein n=1 Tax=Sistotremastrum suecicum HHB10207 ss-3 TaxID=1314776 RepID=A0A165ZK95_9AGAM|nr:hypothetical protein SISSUDRAFT_1052882 [Sistotremastrum suecicum HHB10207 ss-3]